MKLSNWSAVGFFVFVFLVLIFGMWMVSKGNECPQLCVVTKVINESSGNKIPLLDSNGKPVQTCGAQDCSKYILMGWGSIAFIIALVVFFLYRGRQRRKIPFDIIKKAYIERMNNKEKVYVNSMAETFKMTEEGERYVFVLRHEHDSIYKYFMCEADMYTGDFGRGFGQYTDKMADAYHWFMTRKRVDVEQEVIMELSRQNARDFAIRSEEQKARMQALRNPQNPKGEFK